MPSILEEDVETGKLPRRKEKNDDPQLLAQTTGMSFKELLQEISNRHSRVQVENLVLRQQLDRLQGDSWRQGEVSEEEEGAAVRGGHSQQSYEDSVPVEPENICLGSAMGSTSTLQDVRDASVVGALPVFEKERTAPRGPSAFRKSGTMHSASASSDMLMLPSAASSFDQPKVVTPPLHTIWLSDLSKSGALDQRLKKSNSMTPDLTKKLRGGDNLVDNIFIQRFVLSPNSRMRMCWDFCSLIILCSDIIMVPLIAFDLPESAILQLISKTCIIFWTCDVGISFLSGYHVGGAVELRPRKIVRHYVRSWFAFDATVIMLDWLLIIMGATIAELVGVLRVTRLIRFTHVLRVMRLLKMPAMFDDLAEYVNTETLLAAVHIGKSLIIIGCVNHFVACGWYAVGKLGDRNWVDHWMERHNRSLAFRYVSALHWSLTQFTPASMEIYPQCVAERIYAICVLFLALVVFSSFVSSITNAMNHLRQMNQDSSRQRENLRRFIHENRLSLELGNRITAFARHHAINKRTRVHEKDIELFKVLPETLRLQLHWEVYVPLLSVHPFIFNIAEIFESFVLAICHGGLTEESLTPGQELFTRGLESKRMYFTIGGCAEYYYDDEDLETAVIETNQWACEVTLWMSWRNRGRLCAVKWCEYASLDGSTFRKCATFYPGLFDVCRDYAHAFQASAKNQAVEHLLDIWSDHDVLQDLTLNALEACQQFQQWRSSQTMSTKSSGERGKRRPWHTLSLVRKQSPAVPPVHENRSHTM